MDEWNDDEFAESRETVTPAEAGVQNSLNLLDSCFRGNDKNGEIGTFYETINDGILEVRFKPKNIF